MRTCSCPEEATGGFASGSSCGLRTTLRILRPLKLFLLARSSRVSWLLSRIASARLVASSGVPRIAAGSSSRHRSRSVQSSTLSLMTARLVIIPNFDSKTARGPTNRIQSVRHPARETGAEERTLRICDGCCLRRLQGERHSCGSTCSGFSFPRCLLAARQPPD
jgi:hypothetical protein